MAPRLPPKKEVALKLLEQSSVYIHLDPRREKVVVPAWFKKRPQLVLQVGLNMPVPIPDLNVDDERICCTLSFNRAPFFCWVPWEAIFALVGEDGRGMVWPEDIPPEVAAQAQKSGQEPREEAPARARGHLRAVKGGEGAAEAAPAATEERASEPADGAEEPRDELAADAPPKGRGAALASVPAPAPAEPSAPAAADARGAGDVAEESRSAEDAAATSSKPLEGSDAAAGESAGGESAGGESAGGESAGGEESDAKKRKLPPYLRIVK
jgi:stringent starvation protein B